MSANETPNERNYRLLKQRFANEPQIHIETHYGNEHPLQVRIIDLDGNEETKWVEKIESDGNETVITFANENEIKNESRIGVGIEVENETVTRFENENENGIRFENELLNGNENQFGNEIRNEFGIRNEKQIKNQLQIPDEIHEKVKTEVEKQFNTKQTVQDALQDKLLSKITDKNNIQSITYKPNREFIIQTKDNPQVKIQLNNQLLQKYPKHTETIVEWLEQDDLKVHFDKHTKNVCFSDVDYHTESSLQKLRKLFKNMQETLK